ncbi:hypothetical protein ACMSYB_003694 [Proteus mirabilis]
MSGGKNLARLTITDTALDNLLLFIPATEGGFAPRFHGDEGSLR